MASRRTDTQRPDGSAPKSKIDDRWNDLFVLLTRGFIAEFCFSLSRNAWILYTAIGTFYSLGQKRAFPGLIMLDAICPLSRYSRSRALKELLTLGLVEVWAEKRGRRRRTFFRLPYVTDKGHHVAQRQQKTGDELRELIRKHQLPTDMEWARRAYRKGKRAAGRGEGGLECYGG